MDKINIYRDKKNMYRDKIYIYIWIKINVYSIIKTNIKMFSNFHKIIMYLRKKIAHFKKCVMEKVHILTICHEFC